MSAVLWTIVDGALSADSEVPFDLGKSGKHRGLAREHGAADADFSEPDLQWRYCSRR